VKKVVILAIILILLASAASAIHQITYFAYTGQAARQRRLVDPYTRQMYFPEGYVNALGGFGRKSPVVNTQSGMKSAYSATHNLPYDQFSTMRGNPNIISNYLSTFKGFQRMDTTATLLPLNYQSLTKAYPAGYMPNIPHGTARILSLSNNLNTGMSSDYKQGKVYIHVLNMPPLNKDETYEFWLVDKETEYPMSLGLMRTGLLGTGYFTFEIFRPLVSFDYVMVTREKFPDNIPWPNGEIVLFGAIQK